MTASSVKRESDSFNANGVDFQSELSMDLSGKIKTSTVMRNKNYFSKRKCTVTVTVKSKSNTQEVLQLSSDEIILSSIIASYLFSKKKSTITTTLNGEVDWNSVVISNPDALSNDEYLKSLDAKIKSIANQIRNLHIFLDSEVSDEESDTDAVDHSTYKAQIEQLSEEMKSLKLQKGTTLYQKELQMKMDDLSFQFTYAA